MLKVYTVHMQVDLFIQTNKALAPSEVWTHHFDLNLEVWTRHLDSKHTLVLEEEGKQNIYWTNKEFFKSMHA